MLAVITNCSAAKIICLRLEYVNLYDDCMVSTNILGQMPTLKQSIFPFCKKLQTSPINAKTKLLDINMSDSLTDVVWKI